MILLLSIVLGFVISLPISLALGASRRRQWRFALACPALLAALVALALARGCPANANECSPELTLFYGGFFGTFVLLGCLLGIAAATGVRRVRQSRSGSAASRGVR